MSALRALQGLVGGLSSGLGTFTDLQKQQAEIANREKLAQVAQQAEERQRMADEWEQQKAAYEAMTMPIAADDPLVGKIAGRLPLIKGADGMLSRPLSKAEQAADIAIKAGQLKQEGRDYIAQNPMALNNPETAYQVMAKFGFTPNEMQVGLPVQSAEAQAKYAPQAAVQLAGDESAERIAAGRNATDLSVAKTMSDRAAMMQQEQDERVALTAQNRAVDPVEFDVWSRTFKAKYPNEYNHVLREHGQMGADNYLLDYYKKYGR